MIGNGYYFRLFQTIHYMMCDFHDLTRKDGARLHALSRCIKAVDEYPDQRDLFVGFAEDIKKDIESENSELIARIDKYINDLTSRLL